MSTTTPQNDAKKVANRTIVQAAVLAFVVLLSIVAWLAFDFILLLFASILFGVLIHGVSRWLCSKTALSYKLSMGVFFVLLLLGLGGGGRSEEHTSELQSLMRISYAVFCLKKKLHNDTHNGLNTF